MDDPITIELTVTDPDGLDDGSVSQEYILSADELDAIPDDQSEREHLQGVIEMMGESVSIKWDQERSGDSE